MKLVWIVVIALVALVGVVVGVSAFIGKLGVSSPSYGYITPSEAQSTLGGNWTLSESGSFYFTTYSNGSVLIKFFDGKTTLLSGYSDLVSEVQQFLMTNSLPSQGMFEYLTGIVNGQPESIVAIYAVYPSPSGAQDEFQNMSYWLHAAAAKAQYVSNGELAAWQPGMSAIAAVKGNTVYYVQVQSNQEISASQLEQLLKYIGG